MSAAPQRALDSGYLQQSETVSSEPDAEGTDPGVVSRWAGTVHAHEEIAHGQEEGENHAAPENRLWIYRDRTMGLLRRYCRFAMEVGRLPSLLGREFFRTRISSYRTSTFEDTVIFVHDVERCLEHLDSVEKELIARIVLQDYTQEEAAQLMGCGYRTVARRFPETLDRVTELFLEKRLLIPLPEAPREDRKSCQEGESAGFSASDLKQGE